MINPLIKNRKSFYYFLFIWLFLGLIQSFLLFYFYNIPIQLAFLDSLVFNFIFCVLAINLWYVVKYLDVDSTSSITIVINHLIIAIATISLWLISGIIILKLFKEVNTTYILFVYNSLPPRFLFGLFLYSVVILLYYSFNYYSNLQDKIKEEAQLQTLIKEAELNTLKSQINPHFIFNSLNSISSLTLLRPAEAREMIIKLSDFLRYSLDQDLKEKTMLKNELENIKRYLEIEKIRFGQRLHFEIEIEKGSEEAYLPNMILQPLIENAIKHGVHESTEPIQVEIKAALDNHYLKLSIKNNYDSEGTIKKRTGIGIQNIQNRLQLIYGRADLFKILNKGKTFEVFLLLPQFQKEDPDKLVTTNIKN